ncbi:beta strand repeat-containing protein [Fontivita pretiosa]|uniref:beta strand repeat-containing protein n=1 Tax=Fontivita pretiosa TaxID=2989684 RepID=UPI003D16C016
MVRRGICVGKKSLAVRAACLACAAGAIPAALGQGVTWTAGAGNNTNWSEPSNWNVAPAEGGDVFFAQAGSLATVNSAITVGSIQFNIATGFTIAGSATLTINSGIGVTGAGSYTIATPVWLGASNTWNIGTGNLHVSGVIGGSASLHKTGGGTLAISSASTYSGPTTVSQGVLEISVLGNHNQASGIGSYASNDAANLLINGGTLRYVGSGATTDRAMTIGPNGATIDAAGSGALIFDAWNIAQNNATPGARTLTLSGSNTANNTFGLVIYEPNAGGTISLVKTGSGRWIIPATVTGRDPSVPFGNEYTGATQILGGVLEVHADYVSNGAGGFIHSGGLRPWLLGGTRGGIGVSDENDPSNLLIDGGTLRYVYDGTFVAGAGLGDPAHDAGQVARRFTIGPGGATIEVSGNGPLNLSNSNPLVMSGSGDRVLTLSGTFADNTEGTSLYNGINGIIADPVVGTTSLVKDGPGEWVLTASGDTYFDDGFQPDIGGNTYSGSTTINAGTLLLAHGHNRLPAATSLHIASGAYLELFTGDSVHPEQRIGQEVASLTGGGVVNLNGGSITINNASDISFDGLFTENLDGGDASKQTGGRIIKSGAGRLTLTGNSNNTGSTTVNNGTLQIGNGGASGALGTGQILLASSSANLVFSRSDAHVVANVISGGGNVYKAGSGTLTLSGNSSYSGTTTVQSGKLLINGALTGGGTVTVQSGATLGGIGSVAGAVNIQTGGSIAPGQSVGSLATGDLIIASGATYFAEIDWQNNLSLQPIADRLNVTGSVTLQSGSALQMVFLNVVAGQVVPNRTVVLIDNDGTDPVNGTFGIVAPPTGAFAGLISYTLYYNYDADSGQVGVGNDIAVTFHSVPEPSSLAIVAGALLACRGRGSRRPRAA